MLYRYTGKNADLKRILSLPVDVLDGEAAAAKWTASLSRSNVSNEMPLWPIQGEALESMDRWLRKHQRDPFPYGPLGQLDPIGVGHGKTLITFLLPEVVRRIRGDVTPMLIVPAPLVGKTRVAHGRCSRYYRYPVPDIVSMSIISHMNHSDVFERHKPDIILIDESHQFGGESTRTKRLQRWVVDNPETIVVSLSGTLTDKSIKNYMHMAEMTHRHMTPIPEMEADIELWQSVLDVGGRPTANARKAFMPVVNWQRALDGEPQVSAPDQVTEVVARKAYQRRLRSLPGVVGTDDASCKASLEIREWKVTLPPSWTEAAFDLTEEGMWETPGGEEIVDALQAARARAQVSSGYYTEWIWPDRECRGHWVDEYRGCTRDEDCLCEGTGRWAGEDHEWLHHRRVWAATERHTLKALHDRGMLTTGQDSPALIRDLAARGKLGAAASRELAAWMEMRPRYHQDGRVEPPVEYVDLDPGPEWLAELAKTWGRSNRRGIIWYATPHVGRALGAAGFKVFGAGTELGDANRRSEKIALPAAKIDVQGTGKNLQAWSRNLVLEFPGSARAWEQFIGRTHRPGQPDDAVSFDVVTDGGIRTERFASARLGARYIQDTVGTRQRLCYATMLDPIEGKYRKAR